MFSTPRGTVSTTVTIGRSFKMQTRGPWGFKTPAIPGFRSAANLARASYGFTPPLTRFYSRAGRQTFSAPIPPLSAKFSYAVYKRWKRSEVDIDRGILLTMESRLEFLDLDLSID